MKIVKMAVILVAMIALVATMSTAMACRADVKPGSSPNAINLNSKGVLPVAIPGNESIDVRDINLSTVRLAWESGGSVAPLEKFVGYEDIISEDPDVDQYGPSCFAAIAAIEPDGYEDLLLKFSVQEMVGEGFDADVKRVEVQFEMNDGTYYETLWECVKVIDNSDKKGGPK